MVLRADTIIPQQNSSGCTLTACQDTAIGQSHVLSSVKQREEKQCVASPLYLHFYFPLNQHGFHLASASISVSLTPLQVCWEGRLNCRDPLQLRLSKLVSQISTMQASTKTKLCSVNAAHSKMEWKCFFESIRIRLDAVYDNLQSLSAFFLVKCLKVCCKRIWKQFKSIIIWSVPHFPQWQTEVA